MKIKVILLALITAAKGFSGPYDSWTNYRTITINTTTAGVTGTVTNFPLLVRLTNASTSTGSDVLAGTLASGADIRFTDATGSAALSYQTERWTAAAAEIWVLVPSIAGSASTTIRMYWGKSGSVDASSGSSVFQTSNNFQGVWHMNEPSGNINDATANGITGTNTGTTTNASAAIGVGRSFNGTSQYINLANNAALNFTGSATLEAWIQWTSSSGFRDILNHGSISGEGQETFLRIDAGQYRAGVWDGSADHYAGSSNSITADASQWVHLVGVDNGSSWLIYENGAPIATTATGSYLGALASDDSWHIGAQTVSNTTFSRFFSGAMDEVRISSTARSADWIMLDYQTQKANVTCVTMGSTQSTTIAPVITGNPTSQTVTVGSQAIFTVQDSGTAPFIYKWVKNNTDTVSGAVTDTLTLNNVQNTDSGSYKVVVLNSSGSAVSASATLTVTTGPAITSQPDNAAVLMGATAKFGIVASGTPTLVYKWVKNNTDTVGGLDSLTLGNVQLADNGATYKCVVRNGSGQAISISATLTVLAAPSITTNPVNQTVNIGAAARFWVVASGTTPFSYKWVKNNTDTVSGAVTDTLKINNVQNSDTGSYKCVVSNSVGQAVSGNATLVALLAPVITSQPSDQYWYAGTRVQIGLLAAGTPPLTYKWVKNNTDTVSGATTDTLTFPSVQVTDNGTYKCVVSNSISQTVSNSVNLTAVAGIAGNPVQGPFGLRISGSSLFLNLPNISGHAQISISDLRGQVIWRERVSNSGGGLYNLGWNEKSGNGYSPSSGIYLFNAELYDVRNAPVAAFRTKFLYKP